MTLLQRLREAGSTGLDLSPGDPLCIEAADKIERLTALASTDPVEPEAESTTIEIVLSGLNDAANLIHDLATLVAEIALDDPVEPWVILHRACINEEHDPENGKISGFCVRCGTPWPCEYSPESCITVEGEPVAVRQWRTISTKHGHPKSGWFDVNTDEQLDALKSRGNEVRRLYTHPSVEGGAPTHARAGAWLDELRSEVEASEGDGAQETLNRIAEMRCSWLGIDSAPLEHECASCAARRFLARE